MPSAGWAYSNCRMPPSKVSDVPILILVPSPPPIKSRDVLPPASTAMGSPLTPPALAS